MRPLLSPEEMGRADAATIASGTPGAVLMERAGRAVARAAIALAGRRYGNRVAIVCGPGNNGGDGFVAARILRREGLAVTCLLVGDPDRVSGDARHHLGLMERAGVRVEPFEARRLASSTVVVDALFGTGFKGAAEGAPAEAIGAINATPAPVVAVDIPSGVSGATGATEGPAVRAAVTVTMAAEKVGTAVAPGATLAGAVEIADIGIDLPTASIMMVEPDDVARVLPERAPDSHKRSNGSVVVVGGSAGMSGAVVLTCLAAARAGAGYVTAGVTAATDPIVSLALTEVLTDVASDDAALGPASLDRLGPVIERADAVAVGPGLGRGESQSALVARALEDIEVPLVIDADGLNALAGVTDLLSRRAGATVLTPHPGELARLLDTSTSAIGSDRVAAARRAAARLGCVVLLKGLRTLVAAPDGSLTVNPTGGSELATAGTGDVLTGVVTALLAQGLDPFEATWASAYVHGFAGTIAGGRVGNPGVLASDVAAAVPRALAECRLR